MRRALRIAALLCLIAGLLGWVFRGEIATLVMGRVAAQTLGSDQLAKLPDGLSVAFCGAGSPLPDPARSGPCVAVIAGNQLIVVDAGSNGVRNLQRMRLPAGRIASVLLTHFHSDHIDGLGELAMQRWVGAAHQTPLPVYGPPGVEDVVAGFNLAYGADFGYRTQHHGPEIAPPSGAGSRAVTFALPAVGEFSEILARDGLTVRAFAVEHDPVEPAVGYRFEYRGRSIVISGDTRSSEAMATAAKGADLLVHEALAPQLVGLLTIAARSNGQSNLAQITEDILDYHTSPVEAARIASSAGVGQLVLYHVVPPLLIPGAETAFLNGVEDAFDGPIAIARDGMLVSIPADDVGVFVRQLL